MDAEARPAVGLGFTSTLPDLRKASRRRPTLIAHEMLRSESVPQLSPQKVGAAVLRLNSAKQEQKRREKEETRDLIRHQKVALDRETRDYLGNGRKWNPTLEHTRMGKQSQWTPGRARNYASSDVVKLEGLSELRRVQATLVLESRRKGKAWREFRKEREVVESPRRVTHKEEPALDLDMMRYLYYAEQEEKRQTPPKSEESLKRQPKLLGLSDGEWVGLDYSTSLSVDSPQQKDMLLRVDHVFKEIERKKILDRSRLKRRTQQERLLQGVHVGKREQEVQRRLNLMKHTVLAVVRFRRRGVERKRVRERKGMAEKATRLLAEEDSKEMDREEARRKVHTYQVATRTQRVAKAEENEAKQLRREAAYVNKSEEVRLQGAFDKLEAKRKKGKGGKLTVRIKRIRGFTMLQDIPRPCIALQVSSPGGETATHYSRILVLKNKHIPTVENAGDGSKETVVICAQAFSFAIHNADHQILDLAIVSKPFAATLFEQQNQDGTPSAGAIVVTMQEKASPYVSAPGSHNRGQPPIFEDVGQLYPYTHVMQYNSDIKVPLTYVRDLRLGRLERVFDLNYNRRPEPEGEQHPNSSRSPCTSPGRNSRPIRLEGLMEMEFILESEWADKGFPKLYATKTSTPLRMHGQLQSAGTTRSLDQSSVLRYLEKDAHKFDGSAGALGI